MMSDDKFESTSDGSRSRPRLDLFFSYFMSIVRVASWMIVLGAVYRWFGAEVFAALVLMRSVSSLAQYAVIGIGPTVMRFVAEATAVKLVASGDAKYEQPSDESTVLQYATPGRDKPAQSIESPGKRVFVMSLGLSFVLGVTSLFLFTLVVYVYFSSPVAPFRLDQIPSFTILFAVGLVARLAGDSAGAILAVRKKQWLDCVVCAACDLAWLWMSLVAVTSQSARPAIHTIAYYFALSGAASIVVRNVLAGFAADRMIPYDITTAKRKFFGQEKKQFFFASSMLVSSLTISLGHLADFLYAPTNLLLLYQYVPSGDISRYAAALQFDAALMLLVGGLGAWLLPRFAVSLASGDYKAARKEYVRSTWTVLCILILAAMTVVIGAPVLFRIWLGEMPNGQWLILAMVMVHTVIGGTSVTGRAVLLGGGHVRAYTIAAIIAGVCNVVLAYLFLAVFGWGAVGVVVATILVTAVRCGIWMPWFVLRKLDENDRAVTTHLAETARPGRF